MILEALQEGVLHAVVHDEVHVALAVAQLGVFERVVGHAVLVLHDGQRTQALGQHGQALGMHADFARLCAEDEALHADEVAQVQQALEDDVIHIFVLVRADVVAGDVHLDTSLGVLQFDERGFAHDASAHDASGDGHLARLGVILEVGFDVRREGVGYVLCRRIGFYAHGTQLVEAVPADDFLFTQF